MCCCFNSIEMYTRSSCCGSVGYKTRPVSTRMWVQSLASLRGLGIWRGHEQCRRSQISSDSTPSLGTSICRRCSPKKQKKKKKKKEKKKKREENSHTTLAAASNLQWSKSARFCRDRYLLLSGYKTDLGSSRQGTVETNPIRNHEVSGSIPGLSVV